MALSWLKTIKLSELGKMLSSKCLTCSNRQIKFNAQKRMGKGGLTFGKNMGMVVKCNLEIVMTYRGRIAKRYRKLKSIGPRTHRWAYVGYRKNCSDYEESSELLVAYKIQDADKTVGMKKALGKKMILWL